MMARRILTWLTAVMPSSTQETVVIVSHANAMIPMLHWWLQLDETYYTKISYEFACCSVTSLTINPWKERTISTLNDTSHLQGMTEISTNDQ